MPAVVDQSSHPGRLRTIAWVLTVAGLPLAVLLATSGGERLELSSALLGTLVVVLVIALLGGRFVGAVAAVFGSLLVNWYFVEPLHTLSIADPEHLVALVVFVTVAITTGALVDTAARRAAEAHVARAEAELLARSAGSLVADADPLVSLLETIRTSFGLHAVRLVPADDVQGLSPASAGSSPGLPRVSIPVAAVGAGGAQRLDLYGRTLSEDDQRVLRVLVDQVAVASEARRLTERAAAAAILADVDVVRTALLRAVSHDLRTPLASIKAMVSGLRDPSVQWTGEQLETALATVEEETDRLNRLVGNLLDASRLESGALAVDLRPTAIGEVIAGALDSLGPVSGSVHVELGASVPVVLCDPVLLERSLANVVANAIRHAPADEKVVVRCGLTEGSVVVEVVDHGPGIAAADRDRVISPFQRLGDQHITDGVGLGLSIAKGFVDAMGGTFSLEDTVGGGLTVSIVLPLAGEGVGES